MNRAPERKGRGGGEINGPCMNYLGQEKGNNRWKSLEVERIPRQFVRLHLYHLLRGIKRRGTCRLKKLAFVYLPNGY